MKRILKWTVGGAAGLFGLFVLAYLGGYLLPKDLEITVTETLAADPAALYAPLDDPAGLQAWWNVAGEAHDMSLDIRHLGGPPEGVGLIVGFYAPGSDTIMEEWEILAAEPPHRIVYRVDFQMFEVERTLTLAAVDGGTEVTWSERGELSNPAMRWLTVLMGQDRVANDFRTVLGALEAAAVR